MLNGLYFKTTYIRPHTSILRPLGGLKIEGPLYMLLMYIHSRQMVYPDSGLKTESLNS